MQEKISKTNNSGIQRQERDKMMLTNSMIRVESLVEMAIDGYFFQFPQMIQ